MSKRSKQLEKEALEQGLTPTKDLKVDESLLSEEEKEHFEFPWTAAIIIGALTLVIIGLVITLLVLK